MIALKHGIRSVIKHKGCSAHIVSLKQVGISPNSTNQMWVETFAVGMKVDLVGEFLAGRCFRSVDLVFSVEGSVQPTLCGGTVITQVLHCPYCQGSDIVRHGTTPEGKQRYRCRECLLGRGRTFLLEYTYAGQSPEVKQQIVDMALNASGIRDTARVLHISPTTVLKELKKRNLRSTR